MEDDSYASFRWSLLGEKLQKVSSLFQNFLQEMFYSLSSFLTINGKSSLPSVLATFVDDAEVLEEMVNHLSSTNSCVMSSILELWNDQSPSYFLSTTRTRLLSAVQRQLDPRNLQMLSELMMSPEGEIVGAEATLMVYILKEEVMGVDDRGKVTNLVDEWESNFIQQTVRTSLPKPQGTEVHAFASRSYDDGIEEVVNQHMPILFAGFALIFIYVGLMLGSYTRLHQKMYLSLSGMVIVSMAIFASYGLCSYLGLPYGPIHPILPFLILGIGVDNVFVMMQARYNLDESERPLSVRETIGESLRHSGLSMTITTFTDVAAFGVGATTILPALRSFCIFALTGTLLLFVFQMSFFVSCMALDERRVKKKRDACCCVPLASDAAADAKLPLMSLSTFMERTFKFLACVLVVTVGITSLMAYGVVQWEQDFDPMSYLKETSYQRRFNDAFLKFFPQSGHSSSVYIGYIDYVKEKDKMNLLYENLSKSPFIQKGSVEFWYSAFQKWINESIRTEFPDSHEDFTNQLAGFLLYADGRKYLKDIKFDPSARNTSLIRASMLHFHHVPLSNTKEELQSLASLRAICNEIELNSSDTPHPIVYSDVYNKWEANKAISSELLRNMGLTLAAVIFTTFLFIGNLEVSFWVVSCVFLTVLDVAGTMHFWGLTLEICSSIELILTVGLAVDYAAHIGHVYMLGSGSRKERSIQAAAKMGPAVLNGGISTLLAFILLANSSSYVFLAFFKVFLSVVVWGLYHGLMYLPVVLSIFGPTKTCLGSRGRAASGEFSMDQKKMSKEVTKETELSESFIT